MSETLVFDRRKNVRYTTDGKLTVNLNNIQNGKGRKITGSVISLSESGLAFRTTENLPSQVVFHAHLSFMKSSTIEIRVASRDDQANLYRGEFIEPPGHTRSELIAYLNSPVSTLCLDRRKEDKERRHIIAQNDGQFHPRYSLPSPTQIKFSAHDAKTLMTASLINISRNGMCISSAAKLDIDDSISMRLSYHDRNFNFPARVRWISLSDSDDHLYGLEITDKKSAAECVNVFLADIVLKPNLGRRKGLRREDSEGDGDRSDKLVRVPHDARKNYSDHFVEQRRTWLSETTNANFIHINKYSIKPEDTRGNIENFVGVAQVPIGILGPLKIKGDYAKGTFFVPVATTEGALVSTYQRGAIAITKAGGARVCILRDENYLDPLFILKNLDDVNRFVAWVENNHELILREVSSVTNHGRLIQITPFIMGRRVILKIAYFTEDAMGANMINFATDAICKLIARNYSLEKYLLRSNFSSEKKAGGVNLLTNYGKEVYVEAIIPKRVVKLYLNTTAEEIGRAWHSWALGSIHAGMIGINAHFANGLAGIFIACGQDVAHITNASVGINMLETVNDGDLYASLKLPNIIVGTVGGGTGLGTQRECLEMIGCYGPGKSKKFAEIVAATLLAGEIGICAGITSDQFLAPHIRASVHTKEKAYLDEIGGTALPFSKNEKDEIEDTQN